ncbi:sulfite exporter TauE/SafE family protein [Rhodococcus opacus]|uniref:sulfite exporter TauE/SafE family protein n=1 Tax=Rhodococcus opacus TaxID=37919 RepID=UPI00294906C2|nr:sulfite exporter TauE/SafE family protein [Rhodococcus opacus]MDV6247044.1 sulfite exporter TauE/SafE family protein [Rhodococcus opacus]
MEVWTSACLIAAAAFLGTAIQRSVGLGFALTAAPIFSLVVGPFEGVLLANALALIGAATVLLSTWRDIDFRKFAVLASAGVVAVVPGALLANRLPPPLLQIFAGAAITTILLLQFRQKQIPGSVGSGTLWTLPTAGAACGFLNATSGAGGPPVAIYAAATKWENRAYVPTLQLTFLCVNLTSLAVKGLPSPSREVVALAVAGIGLGALAGRLFVRYASEKTLRRGAITIALIGAMTLIVKGFTAL